MTLFRTSLWVLATVAGPLLFFWFVSGWYIGIWYARTGYQGPPPPNIIIQSVFIGTPPAFWATIVLWWWLHSKTATFCELYLMRTHRVRSDVGIGIVLGLLWVGIYGLFDVVAWRDMLNLDRAKLLSVPTSLSAGFCEEFLHRGFLFWMLAAAGAGKGLRLVVSSIAFGLAHCFWGPWGMLWTTVFGLTLGSAVLWRGNVWPAVVAHTLLDLCIEPGLIEKALNDGFKG